MVTMLIKSNDFLMIALFPTSKEIKVLVMAECPEELVAQLIHFLISLLLAYGILYGQEPLHVHALLEDCLRTNKECLLLFDAMPPRAKDESLLAVEVLLEVSAGHHSDKIINPAFLEQLPVAEPHQ